MKLHLIGGFAVKAFIGVVEALLGLRFFLKILGASQQAPFVSWIYETADIFLEPFWDMFPVLSLGRYFVVELSTLFAMFVYALFGFFTLRIVEFIYKQIIENFSDTPVFSENPEKKNTQSSKEEHNTPQTSHKNHYPRR